MRLLLLLVINDMQVLISTAYALLQVTHLLSNRFEALFQLLLHKFDVLTHHGRHKLFLSVALVFNFQEQRIGILLVHGCTILGLNFLDSHKSFRLFILSVELLLSCLEICLSHRLQRVNKSRLHNVSWCLVVPLVLCRLEV